MARDCHAGGDCGGGAGDGGVAVVRRFLRRLPANRHKSKLTAPIDYARRAYPFVCRGV